MIHDCALTEHYVVIYDLPVTFDLGMVAGETPRPLQRPLQATDRLIDQTAARHAAGPTDAVLLGRRLPGPDRPAPARRRQRRRALVRDRPLLRLPHPQRLRGGHRRRHRRGPPRPDVRHRLHRPERGPGVPHPLHRRPAAGKVREHRFDEHSQEFPRYDERLTGRRHRYGYAAGVVAEGVRTGDSVLKHDVVAGTTTERRLGAGKEVSEFCFVPSSPDSGRGRRAC